MTYQPTWGGRFGLAPSDLALEFSASVDIDRRLANEDIAGSKAHARMLGARGILSADDVAKIVAGLDVIRARIEAGTMSWDPAREDVHMNIESVLTENIGEAGRRLHTARSRNDQVATDMRLWTRTACEDICTRIDRVLAALAVQAERHLDVLMPGYTHLQRAQPVRLSHHLLAWGEMLERDRGRLVDARRRMNESPLGAGALASTTYPIDREATAKALGFERPLVNSIDAVADRDFLVEFVAALACAAVHLSRIAEELVLWSSQEFGFCVMSDAFTTGSSMLPQKKNPDVAELIRGKTARVVGDLTTLLVLLKGLPLSYNRDLQEDKPPAFDAYDTVGACLDVLAAAIATTAFRTERMAAALEDGFIEATEIADHLVTHGVPFRDAHHVAGRLVARCIEEKRALPSLTLAELRAYHPAFTAEIFEQMKPETMVERRSATGGPARARVSEQIQRVKERLAARSVNVQGIASAPGLTPHGTET